MRRKHKRRLFLVIAASSLLPGCVALGVSPADYHVQINPADFQTTVDNPYFPLVPGTTQTYVERLGDENTENVVTVTHDTKTILGVKCIVVHDKVTMGGALLEDTYDWYAQNKDGTVWYFGEDTKEYRAGKIVSTEGSWEAGINGAQPGIIMMAKPTPSQPYWEEYYRGEAEDMGQVIALGDSVTVPYGSFTEAVRIKGWSLLESGSETKWYVKGIGVVREESSAGEVAALISVKRE